MTAATKGNGKIARKQGGPKNKTLKRGAKNKLSQTGGRKIKICIGGRKMKPKKEGPKMGTARLCPFFASGLFAWQTIFLPPILMKNFPVFFFFRPAPILAIKLVESRLSLLLMRLWVSWRQWEGTLSVFYLTLFFFSKRRPGFRFQSWARKYCC